jgi:hypothetical protein
MNHPTSSPTATSHRPNALVQQALPCFMCLALSVTRINSQGLWKRPRSKDGSELHTESYLQQAADGTPKLGSGADTPTRR